MTGGQLLIEALQRGGVNHIFTLCGNGLNPLYNACLDSKIRVIDVRNEQAASYMADSWGRLTRRVGVAAVSSGPGHTNALTGLANAFWDGGPMLLISGASDQSTTDMDKFQEIEQVAMAAPICKYARLVERADKIPHYVRQAFTAALTGRPGPVHLTIPLDVLSGEVGEEALAGLEKIPAEVEQHSPGDAELVREAVQMLEKAERPFILAGSGVFYARGAEALRRFAEQTNIPILTQMWDRGCVPKPLTQYVGIANPARNGAAQLLSQADVVLAIGVRLDYRLGYGKPPSFAKNVRFIRVDVDPAEVNRNVSPAVGILGDPRSVLSQMADLAKKSGDWAHRGWLEQVHRAQDNFLARWTEQAQSDEYPVAPMRLCREIGKFLSEDVTFLLDGGNIGQWTHLALFDRHPENWLICGASGVVGFGLPGAMAVKLARPESPVILLSGDGSMTFTIAEIDTALRHNIPFVVVVADDQAWGIVKEGQVRAYGEDRVMASELGPVRFDRVAEAFGAIGVRIEHPDEIEPALSRGLEADCLTLIHVPIQFGGPEG